MRRRLTLCRPLQVLFPDPAELPEAEEERYLEAYAEMLRRTARLVASWQGVGFCHGVLNTDNMTVSGDTIDYGPFGYMEATDPDFVCNMSDGSGRYSYQAQPAMCRWNCMKLGESLAPILPLRKSEPLLVSVYDTTFKEAYHATFMAKLGLAPASPPADGDVDLIQSLLDTMAETGADFTCTFRSLCDYPVVLAKAAGQSFEEAALAHSAFVGVLLDHCSSPAARGASDAGVVRTHAAQALQTRVAPSKTPSDPRDSSSHGFD